MKRLNIAKGLVVGLVVSFGALSAHTNPVAADTLPTNANTVVSATCFDTSNALTYWSATNPGSDPAQITWTTDDGDETGTYTADAGTAQFSTPYDENEPTESFIFSQTNQDDVTLPVADTECTQPDTPECVDGTVRANLEYGWSEDTGTVSLHTVNNTPLCDDVTVYLSTYTLPTTYSKSGIFDDSSLPQQYFDSTSVVLQKGTAGNVTLHVGRPDACTDFQMDVYYSPEIIDVPYAGHGAQLIYGNIHLAIATDCSEGSGKGAGPAAPQATSAGTAGPIVTPAILAAAPVQIVAAVPQQRLTDTGVSPLVPMLGALLMLTTALFVQRTQTL